MANLNLFLDGKDYNYSPSVSPMNTLAMDRGGDPNMM